MEGRKEGGRKGVKEGGELWLGVRKDLRIKRKKNITWGLEMYQRSFS